VSVADSPAVAARPDAPPALGNEAFVRQTLLRAFVVPIVVMLGFIAILGLQIRRLVTQSAELEHTDRVISTGQNTLRLIVDMETGLRGYLLNGLAVFLEPYSQAKSMIGPSLAKLSASVANEPEQHARVEEIRRLEEAWLVQSNYEVARRLLIGRDNTASLREKQLMDDLRSNFDDFLETEERRHVELSAAAKQTRLLAALSAVVLALTVGGSFGYYNRLQLRRLSENYRAQQVHLDEARSVAEKANLAKDNFLAMLSHELRNPLNTLMLSSQSMRRGEALPEGKARALMAIEHSVKDLERMIADLLDSSRIVSGKLAIEIRPLPAGLLIQNAVDTVRASADAKNIKLTTEMDAGGPLVYVDPDRIQQVLWNLLSNAIKFTPVGGEVRIGSHLTADAVQIRISDNGAGIAPEDLPRVFGRFWQAESLAGRARSGLGLGLSISRSLVELHGGTLSAYSDGAGRGATFAMTLPIHPA
jgi:signal transduction histidine kinase